MRWVVSNCAWPGGVRLKEQEKESARPSGA
jgi:hypothetical protein